MRRSVKPIRILANMVVIYMSASERSSGSGQMRALRKGEVRAMLRNPNGRSPPKPRETPRTRPHVYDSRPQ